LSVNLVPIPGVTDQDFRTGRAPRYKLLYSYDVNGQKIVDSVPGEFAADVSSAAAKASAQNAKDFQTRRKEILKQKPFVMPGVGVQM
jgi:hypothetical protein